jgi:hypothetical protein
MQPALRCGVFADPAPHLVVLSGEAQQLGSWGAKGICTMMQLASHCPLQAQTCRLHVSTCEVFDVGPCDPGVCHPGVAPGGLVVLGELLRPQLRHL